MVCTKGLLIMSLTYKTVYGTVQGRECVWKEFWGAIKYADSTKTHYIILTKSLPLLHTVYPYLP